MRVLVAVGLASACGGPAAPTRTQIVVPPVDQNPPPPQTPPNSAPTVALTVGSPRVDAGQQVAITANVTDDLTPVDQLTYVWSATPVNSVFTGTGRQVSWLGPAQQPTPGVYAITVVVTELFTEGGVAKEHKVTATTQVRYNDSLAEVNKLSVDFLNDFANSSVSPEQCVRNFSDSCPGKSAELSDIRFNRDNLVILSSRLGAPVIQFNGDRTFANSDVPCTFVSTAKATGKNETASGTCMMTAVYENFRWFLCDSRFAGTLTTQMRGLHPGRLISAVKRPDSH